MFSRHDLSDADWDRIEPLIPGGPELMAGWERTTGCSSTPCRIGPRQGALGPTSRSPTRVMIRPPTGRRFGRRGPEPCIPPRRNRIEAIDYDRHLYKERNVAERYFARIKQYRRVATRYDKKAANFLGFVWIASIGILLS